MDESPEDKTDYPNTETIHMSKETRESLERGLSQKGTIDRGSFAKYVEEPDWEYFKLAVKGICELNSSAFAQAILYLKKKITK